MTTLEFDTFLTPRVSELYAMLNETRKRLLEQVEDISQDQLDYSPSITKVETIGTLLFHIVAIEFSWIFEDIFGEEWNDEEWKYALALRKKLDPPQLMGKPLAFYLTKLQTIRSRVYNKLVEFSDADLEREVKSGNDYFSIYWILYHVNYHEAVHIGQINLLKRLFNLEHSK